MILIIGILSIITLIMILTTLVSDERKKRTQEMRTVKLKGYWDGGERRSTDRLNVSLAVKYSTNGNLRSVKSVDISTKGIRLLLEEKITKGTPLRLEMKLPNQGHIIKTNGEVAWSDESREDEKDSGKRFFNTGIKFFKFQKSDEKRLFDFIHSLQQ